MSALRAILFLLVSLCAPAVSFAACPGTSSNCPSPTYNNLTVGGTATFNGTMTGTGLNALFSAPAPIGSVTPNSGTFTTLTTTGQTQFGSVKWVYATLPAYPTPIDTALAAAITQCAALGTKLILPAGIFLMDGSHAPPLVQNCAVEGASLPGSVDGFASPGTMIEITGNSGVTTPPVFYLGKGFAFRGISFYWPNQTGTTVYPPLFADNGTTSPPVTGSPVNRGEFSNIRIMNAYDGIAQINAQWGNVRFTDVEMFAVRDNFRISSVGDGISLTNVRISPGAWLGICGSCNGPVGQASHTARAFHVEAPPSGAGGFPLNVNATNLVVVGAQYGFLLDSGATVAESNISATWDAVGTIIDSSSGGLWSPGNVFIGQNAACYIPATTWGGGATGNEPCFNMGGTGELDLNNFQSSGTQGDFIKTTGANVFLSNSASYSIGSIVDGSDYYQLNYASSGSGQVRLQGNQFGGINGSTKVHGYGTTSSGTPSVLMFQGNTCQFLNDCAAGKFPAGANITGNTSFGTKSGSHSFTQSDTSALIYNNNYWDLPTAPTITDSSSCGAGCALDAASTANSGTINLGTGSSTGVQITLPITIYGRCMMQADAAVAVGVVQAGSPTVLTAAFANIAGFHLKYNCPGSPQ